MMKETGESGENPELAVSQLWSALPGASMWDNEH